MIQHQFDTQNAILHVQPKSPLEKEDFEELARTVDPFIAERGDLAGLIIEAPAFPGWDSPGVIADHFRFVRDRHRHIRKIAVVTDSALGAIAENLASHFVAAQIKKFPASAMDAARQWIMEGPSSAATARS